MSFNYGKQFENLVKSQFCKVDGADITRLYDTTNGFRGVNNVCDFIGYIYPNIFYIEVKVVQSGNTLSLDRLTQYNKMVEKCGIPGVRVGVVVWWVEKQKVAYVPISTVTLLKKNGKKSINIKYIDSEEYKVVEIPSTVKRVFMESDYSVLKTLQDGE